MIKKIRLFSFITFALFAVLGLCYITPTAANAEEGADITKYAYLQTENGYRYDLIHLYEITEITSDSPVKISADGVNFTDISDGVLPAVARFVKSDAKCSIKAKNLPIAGVESATVNQSCWEEEGIDKIYDGKENNYMSTINNTFTMDFTLDGYYNLTGFNWYVFQGYRPYGSIYVSLNGTGFEKWADLTFNSDTTFVSDPKLRDTGYVLSVYKSVKARFIRVEVTGGMLGPVATREFSIYGETYAPDLEDAESITIQGKNQEGAYNTQETALSPGEKISLTAIYGNPACISKTVWESGNKYMLDVDAFGVVNVKRGGTQPYYTVKASVESLDGGVYTDEIKIYVKSKANISSMAELSWYGSQFFYGAPAKAFDGVVGVFGNWLQAMDGIAVYSVKCDFKQQIKFGEMKIHIGVNAPVSILVKAYKLDGTMQELANYTNITPNTTLTIDQVGEYSAFEYIIEEASGPCTIYEIEIFNHDDFPLSNIQQTTVPEQRGPGGRGYYDPIISQPTEITENTYGQKFEKENSPLIFSYSTFEPMILIGAILGAGSIAIIVVMVFTVLKKKRR